MQSGLIQQYENSGPYNFYKELYRGKTIREYYTKKGSAVDIRSQLASQENYNNYRMGRKSFWIPLRYQHQRNCTNDC